MNLLGDVFTVDVTDEKLLGTFFMVAVMPPELLGSFFMVAATEKNCWGASTRSRRPKKAAGDLRHGRGDRKKPLGTFDTVAATEKNSTTTTSATTTTFRGCGGGERGQLRARRPR
jgi:hypothetical protein